MIIHTFLDKCNTIIENSEYNTGLNPVAELNAGKTLTRILTHCNLDSLKESVKNKEIDTVNLTHKLKMTNCGSVNLPIFDERLYNGCDKKIRAASFDVIAFRIPFLWDEGRGFDYNGDFAKETHKFVSKDCSNWFQARNGMEWDEHGVYFLKTLKEDYYNNFKLNDDAIVIGRQHFDNGTENLEIDVTDYINKVLSEDIDFYGIGLAFSPKFESETVDNRFISFFTNHTNTFFLPYLETINNDVVLDDRANFHIGVKNRLYFFVSDNGEPLNLDVMPKCHINNKEYQVKQSGKGNYYVEIEFKNNEIENNSILIDTWTNIKINGEEIDDVEMEFVTLPFNQKITLGKHNSNEINIEPQLYGINDGEKIKYNDIITVNVDFIERFSYGKKHLPNKAYYRVYVKENDREIDVYDYQQIERRYDEHSFIINANELIPNEYFIDIKINQGKNIKHFKEVLKFYIVDNVTNFYK